MKLTKKSQGKVLETASFFPLHISDEIQLQEAENRSIEQFIEKVKEFSEIRELTPYALHSLVKAIYVDEYQVEGKRLRDKEIKIVYNIPREIDLDKLMKA